MELFRLSTVDACCISLFTYLAISLASQCCIEWWDERAMIIWNQRWRKPSWRVLDTVPAFGKLRRSRKTSVQSPSRDSNCAHREYNAEALQLVPAYLKVMNFWVQQSFPRRAVYPGVSSGDSCWSSSHILGFFVEYVFMWHVCTMDLLAGYVFSH